MTLLETSLKGIPRHQGKVRDVYDLGTDCSWLPPIGSRVRLGAADRDSRQGRGAGGVVAFWFGFLDVPNHLVSIAVEDFGIDLEPDVRESLRGRSMLVCKARVVPFECVVRGYLASSGWREYPQRARSAVSASTRGSSRATGSTRSSRRPPRRQRNTMRIDVIRNKGYNSRMMTYATLQSDRREFLALTGLTLQEFQLLLNAFTPAYERRYPKDRTLADRPRQRCAGGGRKGVLDCPEQKLLFLLVYLKTYPLQVLMGELFGLSQPGVNYWIHRLLPVLRDALDSLSVLPERNPNDFAQSQTATGTEPRLIIDGTERRRQRPKSPEKQALHYSGKKKAHTDKNVVIVDLRRKCIGFLSRTYVGKTHDKKIADSEGISYPPKAELYKDTGFQGYEPAVTRTCQAKKKAAPRGTHSR